MEVRLTNGKTIIVEPEPIGCVRNLWRRRFIKIYAITGNPHDVVTVGTALSGGIDCNAVEPIGYWERYIGKYNTIIE